MTTTTDVQGAAGTVIGHAAGLVGARTIEIGLRTGLLAALADAPEGLTDADLAEAAGCDAFYVGAWARAAYGAEVLERRGDRYQLAPGMETVLLDVDSPAHAGGVFLILAQPEIFDHFADRLPTGERLWWDDVSPEFIGHVAGTGRPFWNRLMASGLSKVEDGAASPDELTRVLDLACGSGIGVVNLARRYPEARIVGVDGDDLSLQQAELAVKEAGVESRVELVKSTLEDFVRRDSFDLAVINISMHECRDIDKVTRNVWDSLVAGGRFVISDFPFPADHNGLRTAPARLMSGIQYFEALIDDQLMPTEAFVELLNRHGFEDVTTFDLSPVHAVTHGSRSA